MTINSPLPQAVSSPVTRHAIFLVATLSPDPAQLATVRGWCADISGVIRSVGKRAPAGNLSCVCGFGSMAWDRLFGNYDRLLDFSRAVTGSLFFAPSATLLEELADRNT
ncbi:Dyp-type peroxidase domain-containing protein [Serratia proteamaculans]|uniref:Dyp-type peroxidase domain-containing protein n=1 Tax=Serratia proteamaculans TaxID=28151 RepID=UPI00111C5D26|nr:Dyp-type peroxidase domain-containing protein [Serratia proteamaculans]